MPIEALRDVKALTFDVFGTVVDWRSSVEAALKASIRSKAQGSPPGSGDHPDPLPADLQRRAGALTDQDIADFAQAWRDSYKRFTHGFRAGDTPWKDIDTHHHDSLVSLLEEWQLAGLYQAAGGAAGTGTGTGGEGAEVRDLSLVWHRLRPWPDSAAGIGQLKALGLVTSTLSNGNRSLLADLDGSGGLGFSRIISAEDFGAYKPDLRVYLGAAEKLGLRPGEVAMVAAHLNDLDGARQAGLRTIYVERKGEEDWSVDDERYKAAKEWVDLWIGLDEGGFVEVARRLKSL